VKFKCLSENKQDTLTQNKQLLPLSSIFDQTDIYQFMNFS